MKNIVTLITISVLLLACKEPEDFPSCNDEHIILDNTVEACLVEPELHTEALKNYNEESVVEIIEALTTVLNNYGLIVPQEFDWVKVMLTDSIVHYNDAYLYYTTWDYPPDSTIEDSAFFTSAGFYLAGNNTIYVNLSTNGVTEPTSIVIHELTHIVSETNYDTVDSKHTNDLLWMDLKYFTLVELGLVDQSKSFDVNMPTELPCSTF